MKNVRLIITKKAYEVLKAFSDENYLYNYIVANNSELYDKSIFYNPTLIKEIGEYILFTRDDLTEDDKLVWEQSIFDIKKKNASYYAVMLDTETSIITVYKNMSGAVNLPIVNMPVNFDDFEIIKRIEILNNELCNEEEMEI